MSAILNPLPRDTGVRLSTSLIYGINVYTGYQLGTLRGAAGNNYSIHINNSNMLSNLLMMTTISPGSFKDMMNQELKGGTSYPILNAVLGTAAGAFSAGAGLIWTVVTTGIDLSRRSSDFLARNGDQVWRGELVGTDGNSVKHVAYYFLADPFRSMAPNKGWLLGEERMDATL